MGKSNEYKVEKKEEFRQVTKEGEVEVWFRIWATSKGGTYFHIEVREDELDKADELLAARARKLDAIQ